MTLRIELTWPGFRLFPYEKRLAKREVLVLLGRPAAPTSKGLAVIASKDTDGSVDRFTYFSEVSVGGQVHVPLQARLEASAANGANGRKRAGQSASAIAPRRQSTRYSAHGLHEYRGKFNPQVVRAITNLLGLGPDSKVWDPFCGSGTTLLECAHAGISAFGTDLNPLAVLIANTKLDALRLEPTVLSEEVGQLLSRLRDLSGRLDYGNAFSAAQLRMLLRPVDEPLPNREYLEQWFRPSVLAQVRRVNHELGLNRTIGIAQFGRVVLSDMLRAASLQDPGDLRIRRRKNAEPNYPLIPWFMEALERRARSIVAARRVVVHLGGMQTAQLADVRAPIDFPPGVPRRFDAAITSPPYASALPYVDTQRLSLAFLGLANPCSLAGLEKALVGAREITLRERQHDESKIEEGDFRLPPSVLKTCRMALRLARDGTDGFRRRNVPALLYRYFADMAQVFDNVRRHVRSGGSFALVVGANRTTINGQQMAIDTPRLLYELGQHHGWSWAEVVPLETYQRFDVHQRNSIRSEALVVLQRSRGA